MQKQIDEIELKIVLQAENIPLLLSWIAKQSMIEHNTLILGNTYYDSEDHYFARHKMGLRVRSQDNQYEMTLKMKGEITGGLHIRPEYNLALESNKPDFKALASHYNLTFADNTILDKALFPIFTTNFERHTWLIEYQGGQIEIALDQGLIQNNFAEDTICEIELELKQGNIPLLFDLLESMPKAKGMYLSNLSKAQRGYLVGNREEIAKMREKLTACYPPNTDKIQGEEFKQKLADFIRLTGDEALLQQYHLLDPEVSQLSDLTDVPYFTKNITTLRQFYI